MDASTGLFTATITDISLGFNRVILSFAVLDPAHKPEIMGADSIFVLGVANNGCNNPLTITLEWNTENSDLDLHVTEPGGVQVYHGQRTGVSDTSTNRSWTLATRSKYCRERGTGPHV